MKTIYTTEVTNTGGRNGRSWTDDGKIDVEIGQASGATNPEQLFGAAYSSCYHGALELVMQKARAAYESSKVTAVVSLQELPNNQGQVLAVELKVHVEGMSADDVKRFAKMAHTVCPYSKAIKGNVEITDTVE